MSRDVIPVGQVTLVAPGTRNVVYGFGSVNGTYIYPTPYGPAVSSLSTLPPGLYSVQLSEEGKLILILTDNEIR